MTQLLAADGNILLWIQSVIRQDMLTPIMRVITHLGDKGIFWVLLTLALLIVPKTRKLGILSACALVFSVTVNNLCLKHIINRTRPYEVIEGLRILVGKPDDASFPSGHSAASFASAVALFLGAQTKREKKLFIVLIVLAFLISLSRLYVGVHYPTDVICGIISGICCAFAGVKLGRYLCERIGRTRFGKLLGD